jgi:hypothetical protein
MKGKGWAGSMDCGSQQRVDVVEKEFAELLPLPRCQPAVLLHDDSLSRQESTRVHGRHSPSWPPVHGRRRGILIICWTGVRPSSVSSLNSGTDLLFQAAHTLHEELVQVGAEDGDELEPFEKRVTQVAASCSTRRLNSSQVSSRLRYQLLSERSNSLPETVLLPVASLCTGSGAQGC